MTIEQINEMKYRLSQRNLITDVSVEGLCVAAMEVHKLDWNQITKRSRLQHNVRCREQLSLLIYNHISGANYPMIAQVMQRNHSTIMYNVSMARGFMEIEPLYKQQVELILEKAKQWEKEQH